MRRLIGFLLSICFAMQLNAAACADEIKVVSGATPDLVAGKKIVGSINFAGKSRQLSPVAKTKLREILRLAKDAGESDFLRIEGWAPGSVQSDTDLNLAVDRARIVVQFLQEELKMKKAVYFTGFIKGKDEPGESNRVDIVLYQNVLAREDGEKEVLVNFFD